MEMTCNYIAGYRPTWRRIVAFYRDKHRLGVEARGAPVGAGVDLVDGCPLLCTSSPRGQPCTHTASCSGGCSPDTLSFFLFALLSLCSYFWPVSFRRPIFGGATLFRSAGSALSSLVYLRVSWDPISEMRYILQR